MKKAFFSCVLLFLVGQELFSQTATDLSAQDTRSVPTTPSSYSKVLQYHLKTNSTIGLPNAGTNYSSVLGFRVWSDNNGGKAHEMAFSDDSQIRVRSGLSTSWEAWRKIVTENLNGYVGIGTNNPQALMDLSGGNDVEHIRISQKNSYNGSASSYLYPALSYHAWKDNTLQGVTSQIAFYDRPGTFGYQNSVRTSDIYFQTAYNYNGSLYGQYLVNTMVIRATQGGGNVGIGMTTPEQRLDVSGNGQIRGNLYMTGNDPNLIFNAGSSYYPAIRFNNVIGSAGAISGSYDGMTFDAIDVGRHRFRVGGVDVFSVHKSQMYSYVFHTFNDGATVKVQSPRVAMDLYGHSNANQSWGLRVNAGTNSNDYAAWLRSSDQTRSLLMVRGDGNVGIGTNNPGEYKLAVEGTIGARKVRVLAPSTPWADYVFEENYKLPTLYEVEEHIKQHRHLPNVPSAKEVERDGLDLGDSQAVLLRKIEELTLYIIEQNKKIEHLGAEVEKLKGQQ